jgi:hypothetical protein
MTAPTATCERCDGQTEFLVLVRCGQGHLHGVCPECAEKGRAPAPAEVEAPTAPWVLRLIAGAVLFTLAALLIWAVLVILGKL